VCVCVCVDFGDVRLPGVAFRRLPLLQFAVPPLGGRKGKPFPQISRKREGLSSSSRNLSKQLGSVTKILEYARLLFRKMGEGTPKFEQI